MKKLFRENKFTFILACLTLICSAVALICLVSEGFAEFFAKNIASIFRYLLAAASSAFPFSVGEVLVVLAVLFVVFYIVMLPVDLIMRSCGRHLSKWRFRLIISPVYIIGVVWCLYVLTLFPSYHRYSLENQLLYTDEVSSDDVYNAFSRVAEDLNTEAQKISSAANGESISGMSFSKLADAVRDAVDNYAQGHNFMQKKGFRVKEIALSEPMTYTRISGVYSFFTGESNVNTNYADFMLAYTMAHEYCHSRGIAPENECNFLAFAALYESDNSYLRYSALANMYMKLANSANAIDSEGYAAIYSQISEKFLNEYKAYREFYEKYEEPTVSKVSDSVNNAYLKAQGQSAGTESYSMIETLMANYFMNK